MTGNEIPPAGRTRIRPRSVVWALVTVFFAMSLILSALSAANYTEIVRAKVLAHVITEHSALIELDDMGVPESVNMAVDFTFVNPSRKEIRVWVLSYKSWVRDLPMDLGIDTSRWRIDGELMVNGTEQSYFPMFVATYSFDDPKLFIPPESNMTITRHISLNRTNYPDIMAGFTDIYNNTPNADDGMEWVHYTSAIMFIQSKGLDSFSRNSDLIRRFDGVDITPGVGGAGP